MKKLKFPSAVDVEYFKIKLQKLALKGKMVTGVKRYEMVVEKKAPSTVKYELQPFKGEYGKVDGKEITRDDFIEMNTNRGWTFIGENERYMLFSSDGEVGEFLRIDPEKEYEVVKEIAKKEIIGSLPTIVLVPIYAIFLGYIGCFNFTNLIWNTSIASPILIAMGVFLSIYQIMRDIGFLLKNKESEKECVKYSSYSSSKVFEYVLKGVIFTAIIIVVLLILEGLIKLDTTLKIVMIICLTILFGGWILLFKYRKSQGKLKVKSVLVIIIGTLIVTIIPVFIMMWGIGNSFGSSKRVVEPKEYMEFAMKVEDFGVMEEVGYSRISEINSLLIPKHYMYKEVAGDYNIESEYVMCRGQWIAKGYFRDYIAKEKNRWDDFAVEMGDGEGYQYYSIIKSYETISVIRIGEEVFVFEYDSDLRELGAGDIILRYLNEKRDNVLDNMNI